VYLLCEFWISFTLLLLLPSQTTQKKDWKKKKKETTTTTTTTTISVCARALALCLLARTAISGAACLPAARSRPHHAPARRTKLTTDSRLLSLSQEPVAYENLSANQNKPIVYWIFAKVPNNFLV
jgi:hypothetical protein